MAEALELDELRASALATIGTSKGYLGDPTGVRDLERALELAVAANSPRAGTIANNIAVAAFFALDLRRAGELFDEGRAIAERFGDASGVRWLRAQQALYSLILGRWDDALRMIEEFIAECEAGSPHYLEGRTRENRAEIREARGDVEGALADYHRAVTLARSSNDPQVLLPTLGSVSLAFETHGLADEARDLAREVVELARTYPHAAVWALPPEFLLSRVALECESELREALEDAPPGPWKELSFACLDRAFVRAAEMWAEAGSPPWEARLRLRAAEELIETGRRAEGEEQARRALAFYRTVGATHFVGRCEELLREAKTA
ncbi:MAG: Guanylate cyclase protein [Thermoleophilia bacterium]|nr:Guanylate cyclase protein [Thermoleophilia bacterium]